MGRTVAQLLEEARAHVEEISVDELRERDGIDIILDVRETHELANGTIPGAIHAPRGLLEFHADPASPLANEGFAGRTDARIAIACASGGRSLLAARCLQRMGYERVCSVAGGFNAWSKLDNGEQTSR